MPRLPIVLVLLLLAAPFLPVASGTAVANVALDARATGAILTWSTDEAVATRVEYTVAGGATRVVGNATAATSHRAVLTHLSPGSLVEYAIVAGDARVEGSFVTATALTYFLHNTGTAALKTADEFDSAGDNDARGYNGFGAVLATAESAAGIQLLGPFDAYAAQNGGLLLDAGAGAARLYVKFIVSGPTVSGVGTTVARGGPATATFRVGILSDGARVADGVADVTDLQPGERWVPVDVPLAATAAAIPEGKLSIEVRALKATAGYVFGLEGDHASRVTIPVLPGLPAPRVLKTDFTQGARVVVAVIDTGVNPYHPVYQRPGAVMPLSQFLNNGTTQARVIDLSDAGTYAERVAADGALWGSIAPYELVWFKDTNVLAISPDPPPTGHVIRDPFTGAAADGHGTMTSSTVLANFPDAIIVMIQVSQPGLDTASATRWAVAQPWIDVVTTSIGSTANLPGGSAVPTATRQGVTAGKFILNSAGNDPSPLPTDSQDGPHWVVAVTGSQGDGQGKEILSANVFPDFVADYTVMAADYQSAEDRYLETGGTSFSTPGVAGVVASIVYKVREAKGHTGGIVASELAPGVTNHQVRSALNKTALLPAWSGYTVGLNWNGDHAHPPGAEYLTAQWGQVDTRVVAPAVDAILAGNYAIPPEKAQVAQYKAVTHQMRVAYWR